MKKLLILNTLFFLGILLVPFDKFAYQRIYLGLTVLFVLPGYLILRKTTFIKTAGLTDAFILSLVIGASILVLPVFILGIISVRFPFWLLYFYMALCIVIAFKTVNWRNIPDYLKQKYEKARGQDVLFLLILNALLFLFLTPTYGLITAPLHDPAANSIYAHKLLLGDFLFTSIPKYSRTYPPGAAYMIALLSSITFVDTAKMVLVLTNICNLLSGFAFAFFIVRIFKNKSYLFPALISISFISIFKAALYFTSGKNSQIIGYLFLLSALSLIYIFLSRRTLLLGFISLIIMAISVLIHYNNFPILVLIGFWIIALPYLYKTGKSKQLMTINAKGLLAAFGLLLILLIAYFSINLRSSVLITSDSPLIQRFITRDFIQKPIKFPSIQSFGTLLFNSDYLNRMNVSEVTIYILGVFGFLITAFELVIKRDKHNSVFLVGLLILYYLVYSINIYEVQYYLAINVFILHGIFASHFLVKLISFLRNISLAYLVSLVLVTLCLFQYVYLFKNSWRVRKYDVVKAADLRAFKWISENIPNNYYFLPGNVSQLERSAEPIELDSSLYFQNYSNHEEILSFVYGDIFSPLTPLRNSYIDLGKNVGNKAVLKKFVQDGIKYVFVGSYNPWGYGHINTSEFIRYPGIYSPIYDREGVKIYQINL